MVKSLEASVAVLVRAEQTSRRWWVVIMALTDAMSSSSTCSVQVGRSEGLDSCRKTWERLLTGMITEEDENPVGFSVWDDRHSAGFVTSWEPPRKRSLLSLKALCFIVWKINACVIRSSREWTVDDIGPELKRKVMFWVGERSRGDEQGRASNSLARCRDVILFSSAGQCTLILPKGRA